MSNSEKSTKELLILTRQIENMQTNLKEFKHLMTHIYLAEEKKIAVKKTHWTNRAQNC